MQTSAASFNTVAVIGGSETQSMGLSDDASFFYMLSANLYADKQKAAIREPLCNAWDAHIVAGRTDVPVEIYLDDKSLVIKDHGPGIPEDQIHGIYCIYGNSTKTGSKAETGGFGLGSKAPFAISDTFTVTNCHAGVRTIHAMTRVASEVDGKPGRRMMVSSPTTETGVTVTIPIQAANRERLKKQVRELVFGGGINATLNGQPLATIDYAAAKDGIVFLANMNATMTTGIFIKQGAVLYPVDGQDEDIRKAAARLREMFTDRIHFEETIILTSAPEAVRPQPSREALSNDPDVKAEVLRLLNRAVRIVESDVQRAIRHSIRAAVQDTKDMSDLLRSYYRGRINKLLPPTGNVIHDPIGLGATSIRRTRTSVADDRVFAQEFKRRFGRLDLSPSRSKWTDLPDVVLRRAIVRFLMRPVLRACAETGASPALFYWRDKWSGAAVSIKKLTSLGFSTSEILFAGSVRTYDAWIKASGAGLKGTSPMAVVTRTLSAEKVAALRAALEKRGFTVKDIEPVQAAPRVDPPPRKYARIGATKDRTPLRGTEKFFVEGYYDGARYRPHNQTTSIILEFYPGCVCATSDTDARMLAKAGLTDAGTLIGRDLQAAAENPAFLLGFLLSDGNYVDRVFFRPGAGMAYATRAACRADLEAARIVLGEKIRLTEANRRMFKLGQGAGNMTDLPTLKRFREASAVLASSAPDFRVKFTILETLTSRVAIDLTPGNAVEIAKLYKRLPDLSAKEN